MPDTFNADEIHYGGGNEDWYVACNCEECRANRECRENREDDDGMPNDVETFDTETEVPLLSVPALMIPDFPNRPARVMSFEQETSRGGSYALAALYDAGLALNSEPSGYHEGMAEAIPFGSPGGRKIYGEHDSSCDVEIIYSKLRPDLLEDAMIVGRALAIVRESISRGDTKLTPNAGFHVHVSAVTAETLAPMSQDAILKCASFFRATEDLLYRIAAARWSSHRDELTGGSYSVPPPSTATDTRKGEKLRRLGRDRYGLNISPYVNSRNRCSCTAQTFGYWNECTCSAVRESHCTIEFRLWNATANPTKVRAYLALSTAILAWSETNADSNVTLDEHPYAGVDRADRDSLKRQLRLLSQLPLTDEERSSVAYCMEYSTASVIGPSAIDAYVAGTRIN